MKLASFASLYWKITKPALTRMVVLTAIAGAAVAPEHLVLTQWLSLFFGSWGIVAAANAINCYLEKDVDALMERTKLRPLVTGELKSEPALWVSLAIATASILTLALGNNLLTAFLGFLGFVLYVAIYTPLKKVSMSALFMGAIPGAIPPVMGWTASTTVIDTGAWILFAILFLWQLPHFIAIALHRVEEYDQAGLKTVPGVLGPEIAQKHMFGYTAVLLLSSLLPVFYGMAGFTYLVTQILICLVAILLCVMGFLKILNLNWNRLVFFASLLYLPLVFGAWVVDLWLTP
jgi:protoheme IX farnesyltransferase